MLELVCYIVGHHHTLTAVDSLDFQIIWEADALVNIPAGWGKKAYDRTLPELIEQNFRTVMGRELITKWGTEQGLK